MDTEQISELLHEQNFRLTRERQEVLGLFVNAPKMMTPMQLHKEARNANIGVGLTTVYRLLEVLTKVGLATPLLLQGTVYYTFCSEHHHHHFICLKCHSIQNIYECPKFETLPVDCQVSYHKVDLFGTCAHCTHLANSGNEKEGFYS
jgi:Fur family transcriptional regulator, zinc uptake regulator